MNVEFDKSESLNRPSWTSEESTGMFRAYKSRHTLSRGRFVLQKDYYENYSGKNK
jgi:hypothetical protein